MFCTTEFEMMFFSISYCSNIVPLLTTDECFDEIHECDHLAKCKNTPGNYTCQCPDGYLSQWKDCIGKGKSVYSCFEKGCRKKCTRQPRKVFGWFCLPCSSKKFERMAQEATDICSQVLVEISKSRFDSYSR